MCTKIMPFLCARTPALLAIVAGAIRGNAFGPGQKGNVLYLVADDLRPEIAGG